MYRSSTPWSSTSEIDAYYLLNDLGIQTIIDLRTKFERQQIKKYECNSPLTRLCRQKNIRVLNVPLGQNFFYSLLLMFAFTFFA